MKQIIIICFVMFCSLNLCAQSSNEEFNRQLFQAKSLEMKKTMNLSDKTYDKFEPIYQRYDKAIIQTYSQNRPKVQLSKAAAKGYDAQIIKESILAQYNNANTLIEIKRAFIEEFADILSGDELVKFYQTENSIRNKIKKEFNARKQQKP